MGAYVTPMYGGSNAQIDYRLGLVQHGCSHDGQMGYHTDARERALMWIGEGLEAFGVDGMRAGAELTEGQFEMARRLIRGQHPVTEAQLVAPKVAVAADAKLSLGPLVAAVNEAAQARGVAPGSLFAGVKAAQGWAVAERGVARRGGLAVTRVDEAIALAEAAGLVPGQVWGEERVSDARAAMYEPRVVRDKAGQPVLRADGTQKMTVVERRERVGIAGYDIGINVPKSMSVLLAMAPDAMAARIEGIYAQAANRTFGWTEARTSYVKRGKHGDGKVARHEKSSGMSGWVMTHRTARPVGDMAIGDPHWHVHITVANMAEASPDADGNRKWLTIASGGRDLMRHAPAIDKITQALVRGELNREFGVTFARSARTGVWEVEHIPVAVNDLFSKRGQQVNEALSALGYGPGQVSPKESRVLTRACRSGKSEATAEADVTLREYWRAQAIDAGYDPASWMPAVLADYQAGSGAAPTTSPSMDASMATERANETMAARYGITLDDVVARVSAPEDGLTAHHRRFSHVDAIAAVADALPYLRSETEIVALTDLVLANPVFVALPDKSGEHAQLAGAGTQLAGSHDMAGGQLYTTQAVIDAEQVIMNRVRAAATETDYVTVPKATLEMAVGVAESQQGYRLSDEQRAAVEATVSSGSGLDAIEGPAGTGKTTMMRAARIAYEAAGYTVGGAATAAVAAQGLAAESGIASRTVAQWKWAIEREGGTRGLDVLILDEANLTDDQDRAALYEAAELTHTAVREVGDPKQLRAPGAGSSFGYIHTALNGPTLTDNKRQRDEDARAAVLAWRDGRYLDSLRTWDARGGVVATATADEAVAAMVDRWMRAAEGAPDPHTRAAGLLAVAATNEQVTRLNQAIQGAREARGQLGEGQRFAMPAGRDVTFHVGDQVVIRVNDRHSKLTTGDPVLNGYRGVVVGIGRGGVAVEWREPDDRAGQAPHRGVMEPQFIGIGGLDLGYCLTGHKAEGMTVKAEWARPDGTHNRGTTLSWGPGMDAAGGYVKLSRAAGDTLIFAPLEELEGERERLQYGTPADQEALTERAIAAIAAKAQDTEDNPDDRPVLVDLGQAPSIDDWLIHHGAQARAAATAQAESEPAAEAETQFEEQVLDQPELEPVAAMDAPEVSEHTDPGVSQVPEQEQWDRWGELTGALYDVDGSRDPEAIRVAFDERHAYERDVMGGAQSTWEQYCELRDVTDEQRARHRELLNKSTAAWLAGDPDARAALHAERAAYSEELGDERAHRLHLETMHELEQRQAEREQAAADRKAAEADAKETRRGWLVRPHSTLTADQLERAIAAAERKRTVNLADAEQARQQHTETEPAVLAGQGPRAVAVDASLAELRRVAAVYKAGDELHGRMEKADNAAWLAAGQARQKEEQARLTSRFRPGLRDRLLGEAAELYAGADRAREQSEDLKRQRLQLHGSDVWTQPGTARARQAQLERAETTYPQDRDQAHQLDVQELNSTHQRIGWRETAANTAAEETAGYTAERQLRADMPPEQHTIEHGLRNVWHREQRQLAAERAAAEAERSAEYYRTHLPPTLGQSHDRGMDMGMGL